MLNDDEMFLRVKKARLVRFFELMSIGQVILLLVTCLVWGESASMRRYAALTMGDDGETVALICLMVFFVAMAVVMLAAGGVILKKNGLDLKNVKMQVGGGSDIMRAIDERLSGAYFSFALMLVMFEAAVLFFMAGMGLIWGAVSLVVGVVFAIEVIVKHSGYYKLAKKMGERGWVAAGVGTEAQSIVNDGISAKELGIDARSRLRKAVVAANVLGWGVIAAFVGGIVTTEVIGELDTGGAYSWSFGRFIMMALVLIILYFAAVPFEIAAIVRMFRRMNEAQKEGVRIGTKMALGIVTGMLTCVSVMIVPVVFIGVGFL